MADHRTDFKSKAHNSLSCQQQLRHRFWVNGSRIYSAVRLFLLLCEMQTVPCSTYMDCKSTNVSFNRCVMEKEEVITARYIVELISQYLCNTGRLKNYSKYGIYR